MAKITIDVPDQHVQRVIYALCRANGLADPATHSAAKAKASVVNWIKATVRNIERSDAQKAALEALSEPDTDGIAG